MSIYSRIVLNHKKEEEKMVNKNMIELQNLFQAIDRNKPEYGKISVELTYHNNCLKRAFINKTEKILFEMEYTKTTSTINKSNEGE